VSSVPLAAGLHHLWSESEGHARVARPISTASKALTGKALMRPTMAVGVLARTSRAAVFGNDGAVGRNSPRRRVDEARDTDFSGPPTRQSASVMP
jgi:hypothetical protein